MSSSVYTFTLPDSFMQGLACAAITPGLRSILVLDAPYSGIEMTATLFAQILECATERQIKRVNIGALELDDDLWGRIVLSSDNSGMLLVKRPGLLVGELKDFPMRLVVIPDLTRLSLVAARACVMLVSADVACLEWHGQSDRWQPDICWLAFCARSEVGAVSTHLLDRFALRLTWNAIDQSDRVADLLKQIQDDVSPRNYEDHSITPDLRERIKRVASRWAEPTSESIARVLYYISRTTVDFPRREIALARLALATARLEGADRVTTSHVDTAARLIGLARTIQQPGWPPLKPRTDRPPEFPSTKPPDSQSNDTARPQQPDDFIIRESPTPPLPLPEATPIMVSTPVYKPDWTEVLDASLLPADPYPEDKAPIEREVASLKLPLLRYAATSSGRGTVIGVEQTSTLHDLALVNTLFAAAPYQIIRRQYQKVEGRRLLLSTTDLRRYKRMPAAEKMLLILLDYTCMPERDWLEALEALRPYLIKAYIERASICIVQVGVAKAVNEVRAEMVSARSVLVPSIGAALEAGQGKATPLAHGFDLALRSVRHALQHGRSTVQQVLFLVLSDGRGNIPLEASRLGHITGPSGRSGVEDSLQVAQYIRDMKGVQSVVFNPQPKYYPELPRVLAEALGAEVFDIKHLEVVED